MISEQDRQYLRRSIELAEAALAAGDKPFGSVLVSAGGEVLFEDHNRVSSGDATQHPEFAIARWAAQNMSPQERAQATVYTSGEHCAMCSAAHGWAGVGRIVYASSSAQLRGWLSALGVAPSPVRALPIGEVIADAVIDGPDDELAEQVRELQVRCYAKGGKQASSTQ